jgi:uncharacterized SAM-binding protein YcdF (DUF218 family)
MPKWYERTGDSGRGSSGPSRRQGCLLSLVVFVLLVVFARLWLPLLAYVLVMDQPPVNADAIMIMGGGNGSRQDKALELYRAGWAPLIISSGEAPWIPGFSRSYAEIAADYMIAAGVPRQDILLAPDTTSSIEEAVYALALARERGLSSLLVVTDHYHTLRTSLTFRQTFRGSGITLTFVAARPAWFDMSIWWCSERPLVAVFEEYAKLTYYLFKGYLF